MHDDHLQLYLRAEPTPEGRRFLVTHRDHLHTALQSLELTPRLIADHDLHRTELFLGAPLWWRRALTAVGARMALSTAELMTLLDLPAAERVVLGAVPQRYDVFFTGRTTAVFVLRLQEQEDALPRRLLRTVESTLRTWEQQRRFPEGTTGKLLRHKHYPLARERNGGKPHVTLARGRVSKERQRDVARTVRMLPLTSTDHIPFERIDVRAVRSPKILARYAPAADPRLREDDGTQSPRDDRHGRLRRPREDGRT